MSDFSQPVCRLEVLKLTTVFFKILQVFWDVPPCQCHVFRGVSKERSAFPLKRRKTPATTRLISEDVTPGCECCIMVITPACSPQTRRSGLAVVLDATRSAWRMTRSCIRQVGVALGADAAAIIVLRPEAFWDKQRVDNCARTQKEGEVSRACRNSNRVITPTLTNRELPEYS